MSNVIPVPLGLVKAFILQGDRPVLVDTGTSGSAGRLLAGLGRHGLKPEEVSLLVITHSHPDHHGSLAEVMKTIRAPVAVHRFDADSLRGGAGVEPDVLLEDELDLRHYGVAGKLIWTPGHTRGSVSVVLDSGEAIVGDLVLPRFMAFGPPAIAFWAASRQDTLASIRRVLDLKPSTILTSHGGPYRPEVLARLVR
jgi:hydroxyacylglutathione hydrolase